MARRCLRRRPDDPAVWRARLDWARAAEDRGRGAPRTRASPARSASRRPRCSPSAPGSLAGPATRNGSDGSGGADRARPGGLPAMEKLAELLLRTGQPEKARQLRDAKRRAGADAGLVHGQDLPRRPARPRRGARPGRRGARPAVRGPLLVGARRRTSPRAATAQVGAGPARPGGEVRRARAPAPDARRPAGGLSVESAPEERRPRGPSPAAPSPRFVDDAEAAGLRFTFDNGLERAPPDARDHERRRWPARLRRRRLARRLRRPGRHVPARARTPRTPGTASSATGATARSRTSPSDRGSPRCRAATATA